MSEFVHVMLPIVFFWTFPLIPIFVTGIAAIVEAATSRLRRLRAPEPVAATRETA